MPNTVPNQRTIKIHREPVKADFLGIKNENWQAAARDLRPHALLLYLYFAANANNYSFALSPVAVQEAVGMARSTFNDQFKILVSKGYLVPAHGNTFDFYEVPQTRAAHSVSSTSLGYCDDKEYPTLDKDMTDFVLNHPTGDREINNRENVINTDSINIENPSPIEKPKVKEIVIPAPQCVPREKNSKPQPQRPEYTPEFVF